MIILSFPTTKKNTCFLTRVILVFLHDTLVIINLFEDIFIYLMF